MRFCRVLPLGLMLTLVMAGAAGAQVLPGAQQRCMTEFTPLREAAEKRAKAISAANKRKAPAQEACVLFKRYHAANARMIKFLESNAAFCRIPPQVPKQMKEGRAQSLKIQRQVCAAAAQQNRPPPGPSLSDALGTPVLPDASTARRGPGTFDTLTGNALTR